MTTKDLIILGIHDGHNAGACVLKKGDIIAAISEERITRKKNEAGFPTNAINIILEKNNISVDEIDHVVFGSNFVYKKEFYLNSEWYRTGQKEQEKKSLKAYKKSHLQSLNERKKNVQRLLGINEKKISFIDHHTSHAASAYYACPWKNEKVLVITCDGGGDGISATISIGESGILKRISHTTSEISLGKLYSRTAFLLGMKPNEHEYKIMGLAPYADQQGLNKSFIVMNKLIDVNQENLTFISKNQILSNYCYEFLKNNLENHRFDWIAGAVQKITEELLTKWITSAIKQTGIKKIALAGGTFMNVKANMKILNISDVEDIFIFPSCGDESVMIGAAYKKYQEFLTESNVEFIPKKIDSIYLGPEFSKDEIEESISKISKEKFNIQFHNNIEKVVAEYLENGKIVARDNGKMEFGARALGNRSILADPSKNNIVKDLNYAIKQRDFWMPFATSILFEKSKNIIKNSKCIKSPHMMIAFDTKQENSDVIKSGIHPYDLTTRPQILEKKHNQKYHDLISNFYTKTGIPGILNTSFNLHGEPVVFQPKDAIHTLQDSGLKYLALGNYFIEKI
jgi:carbamoyltransferase